MPISTSEVFSAYIDCRKRKRNKPSALEFESDLANNIRSIHKDLSTGSYEIGTSRCFVVTKPSPREVWAASFRDRVVHHVMYNRVSPAFLRSFSAGSCACIPTRGTLYGSKRLEGIIRSGSENWSKPLYYLKMDISNFFVTIQKDILFDILKEKIHCEWSLELTRQILYHDPTKDYILSGCASRLKLVPPHKSLFNTPSFMGLAIGNQSSQFLANVHMNELDQFVDHTIKPFGYVRYVDDFILVDSDIEKLKEAKDVIQQFLWDRLLLTPNPIKTELNHVNNGVDFTGRIIKPWHTIPRKRVVGNAIKSIYSGESTAEGLTSSLGVLGQSKSNYARKEICRAALKAGYSVNMNASRVISHG